jgi:hypothetical protein
MLGSPLDAFDEHIHLMVTRANRVLQLKYFSIWLFSSWTGGWTLEGE